MPPMGLAPPLERIEVELADARHCERRWSVLTREETIFKAICERDNRCPPMKQLLGHNHMTGIYFAFMLSGLR